MNGWHVTISAAVVLLAGVLVPGQTPWGDRPAGQREVAERGERERPDRRLVRSDRPPEGSSERRGPGRGERPTLDPETVEAHWSEAEESMRDLTPHRLEAFERMPEREFRERDFKDRLRARIVARYLELEEVRRADSRLYDILSEQVQIEDMIFGAVVNARREGAELDPGSVRPLVSRLVQLNLRERQHRVQVLEEALEKEKSRLREDLRREDEMVDRQVDRWVNATIPGERRRGPAEGRAGPRRGTGEGRGGE